MSDTYYVGWIRWGALCYTAHTSGDTTMPGGDVGTTNLDYDVVDTSNGWAAYGASEIEITPPVPPDGYFTIHVTGVVTCTEAIYTNCNLYDSGHVGFATVPLGPIGPGVTVSFDLTSGEISDTTVRFVDFDLYDPDGGGGTLFAGATVELCGVPAPG